MDADNTYKEETSSGGEKKRERSASMEESNSRRKKIKLSPKERAQEASEKGKEKAEEKAIVLCPKKLELAKKYVEIRRNSADKTFQWDELGTTTTRQERSEIRKYVRQEKLLPEVSYVPGTKFPIFPPETVAAEISLPEKLWKAGDKEQFEWLDKKYEEGMKELPPKYKLKDGKAYTWHHHHDDGKMQMVEFGTHNRIKHEGGRTTWAAGDR